MLAKDLLEACSHGGGEWRELPIWGGEWTSLEISVIEQLALMEYR